MISIFDIIEAPSIKSLIIDVCRSAYIGEKFDVLDFIIKHKLINDDCKKILEPFSIVLNYNGEQAINDFHNFIHDNRFKYGHFDDFDYGYWDDYWDGFDDNTWHDFWDENRDKNNHAKKYMYRNIKKKSNKNSIDKIGSNENKKKCSKKNEILYQGIFQK